jgi:CubicO group peptidase (beta-lactamase class C family)
MGDVLWMPILRVEALIALVGLASVAGSSGDLNVAKTAPSSVASSVEDVSSLLEPIRKKYDLPALAGSIVGREGTLAIGATGQRARGVNDPVAIDDRWHLGSCTKAMTSTLVALLVEEGRLSWETTIGEIYPRETTIQLEWQPVTIEHLLRLVSGLPADGTRWVDELSDGALEGPMRDRRLNIVRADLAQPPKSAPGVATRYSNAGYVIAGSMIEMRMDVSWEDLMRQRLFKPLGMTSAGFGPPGPLPQPQGHLRRVPLGIGPDADIPPALGPAGTVHASLEDWGRFISFHLAGASTGTELLPKESFVRMQSPTPGTDDAMGWIATERNWGGHVITASGSNLRWYARVWVAPEEGFAVLVVTNEGGDDASTGTDKAAGALIRHYKAGEPR